MTRKAHRKALSADAPDAPDAPTQSTPERKRKETRVALLPVTGNAVLVHAFSERLHSGLDQMESMTVVAEAARKANDGNMSDFVTMLAAQAYALNSIFVEFTARAGSNLGVSPHTADTYMRLAYKAQAQCRSTVEAVAEIKSPRPAVAFVKQANIAQGPQQVNNQIAAEPRAPAEISENRTNELLEMSHGERLDTGKAGATGGAHQELEAVEKLDGAEIRRRQSD